MVIVVIVGIMLLMGEKYSNISLPSSLTGTPSSPVEAGDEPLLYGEGRPQSQLQMESQSFVVRPGQIKLTYTDALELYNNSMLQFNEECQLVTPSRSFSLSNEVMIDNRSSKPNTFSIGGASVVVGPYDFGFLILREAGSAIAVGCGDKKNVATLIVQ